MYRLENSKDIFTAVHHLLEASNKLKVNKFELSNAILDTADNLLKDIEKTKVKGDVEEIDRLAAQILKKRRYDLTVFEQDYKSIVQDNTSLRSYTLELTTTNSCNWKCEYCFEQGCQNSTSLSKIKIPVIIEKIKSVLNNPWFEKNFDIFKIDFWGGEPFLNYEPIKEIVETFMEDKRVTFHAYTNGSRIDPLLHIFAEAAQKDSIAKQKILIQFSYDGQPIHDKRRLDASGNPTSHITRSKAIKTAKLGIPVSFKATLMIKDFDYFSEVWDDYRYNIFDRFKDHGHISYAPTIDYTQKYSEIDLRKGVLKNQLLDIASKELDFYKEEGRFLLSWLTSGNSFCSAGKNMSCVDIEGNLYYCHGTMYEPDKEIFSFGNIYEAGFAEKIIANNEMFILDKKTIPEECTNCIAESCYRCNVQKHQNSKKSEFMERWMDFTCMNEMCSYFKMIGEIKFALGKILTEDI